MVESLVVKGEGGRLSASDLLGPADRIVKIDENEIKFNKEVRFVRMQVPPSRSTPLCQK
jgi:hypothetical protein